MDFRRAESKDIKTIMELLRQVCMVHFNGRPDIFKENATKYTVEELAVIIKNESTPVFVATDEEGVKGYAFCQIQAVKDNNVLRDRKVLYIDDLCVDENARGKGIGKFLYKNVLSFGKEKGVDSITLNVWALNDGAYKFYKSLGLKEMKIYMEKILEK